DRQRDGAVGQETRLDAVDLEGPAGAIATVDAGPAPGVGDRQVRVDEAQPGQLELAVDPGAGGVLLVRAGADLAEHDGLGPGAVCGDRATVEIGGQLLAAGIRADGAGKVGDQALHAERLGAGLGARRGVDGGAEAGGVVDGVAVEGADVQVADGGAVAVDVLGGGDRKSTRLNSS